MTHITDEAVDAAMDVLFDNNDLYPFPGVDATVRAALEAAVPHLEAAPPAIDRKAIEAAIEWRYVSNPAVRARIAEAILALIGDAS